LRKISTRTIDPERLSHNDALWVYNGLDCCITHEVLDALLPQVTSVTGATYRFSRDLQGPILEMNTRGLRVDMWRRDEVLADYRTHIVMLEQQLDSLVRDGIGFSEWRATSSWRSNKDMCQLLYDKLGLPVQRKRRPDGSSGPTANRDALEALECYMLAEPIIRHVFALRDLGKKVSFLQTAIDPDGRLRTSFNIAGTTTGRLASSYSDFGTGTNLQNVENLLRSVFVADPGMKFCNIDLEQGDSRGVGAIHWNLFRDARYLDACESGDLHTEVARGAFRHLPWTNNASDDRAIANQRFYRSFTYRDAAKRLGHGTNYQGQADKMSRATHIPITHIKSFQSNYLEKFPAFPLWWRWVQEALRDTRQITTILGRQRHFLGDWKDPETIRQAVAYEPQSITADTIDRGLLALWRANRVQMLLQVHDSVLFQFPEAEEASIVPWAIAQIEQTVALKGGRTFVIPGEGKVGWNWSDDRSDPDALRKWSDPARPQRRTRNPSFP
jgi:DNA polymerase I